MASGTCLPVYHAIIVTFNIFLYLLKLCVIAHTSYPFYPHLRQVIAHSKQLVTVQHHVRRINLHILRLAQSVSSLHKTYCCTSKTTYLTERIHPTLHRNEHITDGPTPLCLEVRPVVYIPLLEDFGCFINDCQPNFKRIIAFQTYSHTVFITIGETTCTLSFSL